MSEIRRSAPRSASKECQLISCNSDIEQWKGTLAYRTQKHLREFVHRGLWRDRPSMPTLQYDLRPTNQSMAYRQGSLEDALFRQTATGDERDRTMVTGPLVSVITIFFNGQRFIEEAILSVFSQTYDNWELLLVDDGSTDASAGIAMDYARRYPRKVRYLEHRCHENRGMSASRDLGICQATGDYLTMLDSDDVWLSHKLEQQVTILESHPEAAMVYGNRQYWYGWTGNWEDAQHDCISKPGIEPNALVEPPLLLRLTYGEGRTTHPGIDSMFRREMAIRLGGFEETFRGIFEDQVFLVKVFLNETVYVSDACWTRYRQHADACCYTVTSSERSASWFSFVNWVESYLSENGMKGVLEGAPLWKIFQNELWAHRHPIRFRLRHFLHRIAQHTLPIPIRQWLRTSFHTCLNRSARQQELAQANGVDKFGTENS